jgi:hypothetical protein
LTVQRYEQVLRNMMSVGEGLISRLADADLECDRTRYVEMAWRGAGDEELVGFAERMSRGVWGVVEIK